MARAREEVWPENLDAWQVFQRLAKRAVIETHIGPEVFRRLTEDMPADVVSDLVDRLEIIYGWLVPQKRS